MRTLPFFLILSLMLLSLALPSAASASGREVIKDCAEDGKLDGDYSRKELEEAEDGLPSDIDEYTDCREAIRSAQRKGGPEVGGVSASGGGGGSGAGGITTSSGAVAGTPEDVAELDRITKAARGDKAPTLTVKGRRIAPGSGGLYGTANAANQLPVSLMLVLIAVATAAATGGYLVLRRRFPDAFGAALRIFRR
jgi:hypothetical protein